MESVTLLPPTLFDKILTAEFHITEFAFQVAHQCLPLALTFGKRYGQFR
ncbi:MAG: hypothetical protein WCL71_12675 [Deltaproteobacteria bacterium]